MGVQTTRIRLLSPHSRHFDVESVGLPANSVSRSSFLLIIMDGAAEDYNEVSIYVRLLTRHSLAKAV